MAISITNLFAPESFSGSKTTFTTVGRFQPTDGLVCLMVVTYYSQNIDRTISSVAANGLTWTQVSYKSYSVVSGGNTNYEHVAVYRALSSSATDGAATITWSGNVLEGTVSVHQVTGCKTTGTNAADAVVQSATNGAPTASTTISCTLAAFSNSNNVAFEAGGVVTTALTPEAGYTSLSNKDPGQQIQRVAYHSGEDLSPSFTFPSGYGVMTALELALAPQTVVLGQADAEADTAQLMTPRQPGHWPIGRADEAGELAQAITPLQPSIGAQHITHTLGLTPFAVE